MRYLLDTHVWLWQLAEPDRVSARAGRVLDDPDSDLGLSPMSVWETMVLARKGRIGLGTSPERWIRQALGRTPARMVDMTHEIAIRAERLPGLETRDPVDRFLAATCLVEGMILVTSDRALLAWDGLETLW